MSANADLLTRHIALFNDGVRNGDFGPMVAWFSEDAELIFRNIPVGPYRGRDAIATAYASQPPDDEIVLLESREEDGLVVASYAWSNTPSEHAGDMLIVPDGDHIDLLVVVFGGRYDEWPADDAGPPDLLTSIDDRYSSIRIIHRRGA